MMYMETTNNTNTTWTVTTVQGLGKDTVHVGRRSRRPGMVVSDCNGRTMTGWSGESDPTEVTCKKCRSRMTV